MGRQARVQALGPRRAHPAPLPAHACTGRPRRLLTPPCYPAYSLNAPPEGAAQLEPKAVLGAYVGRCLTSEAAERESSRSAYVSGGLRGAGAGWVWECGVQAGRQRCACAPLAAITLLLAGTRLPLPPSTAATAGWHREREHWAARLSRRQRQRCLAVHWARPGEAMGCWWLCRDGVSCGLSRADPACCPAPVHSLRCWSPPPLHEPLPSCLHPAGGGRLPPAQ